MSWFSRRMPDPTPPRSATYDTDRRLVVARKAKRRAAIEHERSTDSDAAIAALCMKYAGRVGT